MNYRDPVAVGKAFTTAYYTYNWRDPAHLDPVERARPYVTSGYLATLQPLSSVFGERMTATQETSTAHVTTAATSHDAPSPTASDAYVTVTYQQQRTDHGQASNTTSTWNLHLTPSDGTWLVAGVVAQN